MLKQTNINWRQAETPAAAPAPRQFKSPQDELKWLKQNRRNLQGFVRVLEVIETNEFFIFDQGVGRLDPDWLNRRGWLFRRYPQNYGCIGTVLHWFFADQPADRYGRRIWHYEAGSDFLDAHLDLDATEALCVAVMKLKGPELPERFYSPFAQSWPVSYSTAFRELARRYPGK